MNTREELRRTVGDNGIGVYTCPKGHVHLFIATAKGMVDVPMTPLEAANLSVGLANAAIGAVNDDKELGSCH